MHMQMNLRTAIRPFWLVGALLMMLDGLTTYLVLSEVGPGKEANPLAVWTIDRIGLAWMCVLKGLIGVFMVYRLAVLSDRGHRFEWMSRLRLRFWKGPVDQWRVQRMAVYVLGFTVLLMGVVVGNNLRAYLTLLLT